MRNIMQTDNVKFFQFALTHVYTIPSEHVIRLISPNNMKRDGRIKNCYALYNRKHFPFLSTGDVYTLLSLNPCLLSKFMEEKLDWKGIHKIAIQKFNVNLIIEMDKYISLGKPSEQELSKMRQMVKQSNITNRLKRTLLQTKYFKTPIRQSDRLRSQYGKI